MTYSYLRLWTCLANNIERRLNEVFSNSRGRQQSRNLLNWEDWMVERTNDTEENKWQVIRNSSSVWRRSDQRCFLDLHRLRCRPEEDLCRALTMNCHRNPVRFQRVLLSNTRVRCDILYISYFLTFSLEIDKAVSLILIFSE